MRSSLYYPLALLFICVMDVNANENVSWKLGNDINVVNKVKRMLAQSDDLAEKGVTQLMLDVDVSVEDGKVIRNVMKVWYYADTDSIQDHGSDVVYYDDYNSTIEFTEALTITKSGSLRKVDPNNVKIISSSTYDVFTNSQEIIVPYNGLAPGSVTVLAYVETVERDKLEGNWSNLYYPQNTYPRKNFELNVNWTENQRGSWASSSSFVDCIEEKHSLACRGKNIPKAKTDHFVRWRDELGQIIITDTAQWDNIVTKVLALFDSALVGGEMLDKLNSELVTETTTMEEKIQNIHRFVARDIRYVSISDGSHAYTPHSISKTIENRFGDCKDKSALLTYLLERNGIQAYPVLVATERRKVEGLQMPATSYFDHMVICFDFEGQQKCLDATDAHTDWETIPSWIQGKVALSLKSGAQPSQIPEDDYRWKVDIDTKIVVNKDGGIDEVLNRYYKKEYAGYMRGILSPKSNEERQKWSVGQYQQLVSKKSSPKFNYTNVDSLDDNLNVYSEYVYEPFLKLDTDLSYYEHDAWLKNEIDGFFIQNEVYDVHIPGFSVISKYEFDVSSHWQLAGTGAELNLEHKFGTMYRHINREDSERVKVVTSVAVPAQIIAVTDFEDFNRFLEILKRESQHWVYGKKP